MIEYETGETYTRTEHNASATNFELLDFAWPDGRIVINVMIGHRIGALVINKDTDRDLEFLIDFNQLDGLKIPENFYDNVIAL